MKCKKGTDWKGHTVNGADLPLFSEWSTRSDLLLCGHRLQMLIREVVQATWQITLSLGLSKKDSAGVTLHS